MKPILSIKDEIKALFRIYNFFTFLYAVVPLISLPFLGWYLHNWWVLAGILFLWVGVFTAVTGIYWVVLVGFIIYWLFKGLNLTSLSSIFFFSYFLGSIFFVIAQGHRQRAQILIKELEGE